MIHKISHSVVSMCEWMSNWTTLNASTSWKPWHRIIYVQSREKCPNNVLHIIRTHCPTNFSSKDMSSYIFPLLQLLHRFSFRCNVKDGSMYIETVFSVYFSNSESMDSVGDTQWRLTPCSEYFMVDWYAI